ncbi:MAG: hypothetical protein ACRDIB_00175 [Ardenticatenaceae bacterium]
MNHEQLSGLDARVVQALDELTGIIQSHYPEAQFTVGRGYDEPENVHLMTTVDRDDADEVLDLVSDRLVELQVEERIPVYVIPLRSPAKILADLQSAAPRRSVRLSLTSLATDRMQLGGE